MEVVEKPPEWLLELLPEGARELLDGWAWWAVLGFLALAAVLLVLAVVGRLWRALFGRRAEPADDGRLREDLAKLPPPPPDTGAWVLTVEGVPVRLRLVVLAPAGIDTALTAPMAGKLLDLLVPGMGAIVTRDQPPVRVWPPQLSYDGFANTFHRNTPRPEGEGGLSPWVLVCGRARVGAQQAMVGLALEAFRPTTVGRMRLQPHQWNTALRVRERE